MNDTSDLGTVSQTADGWQLRWERHLPHPVEEVWRTLTEPDRVRTWWGILQVDLRVGGAYVMAWQNPGGPTMHAVITACEPPRSFALTWEFGGGTSWVEVGLAEAGDGGTRLTLRHIAPLDDKSEEFWDRFGPGAVGVGWDLSLLGLAWHLETGEAVKERFAEETWPLSDEGKAFATSSSAAWTAASIAYGTAADAANRTANG